MSIKKIVAFTGIRSDYDLLSGFYSKINDEDGFELKLIVSGSHLSEKQGYTINEIYKDEIPILTKIESLIDSNNPSGRVKSLSILLQNSIHTIVDYEPDLIIIAGDREEVPVGALIGAYLNIPVAHFFGGDHASDGHVDNPVRHASSKLANIHFVSNQISANRLLKMGEDKRRVFEIGSPSLDKFNITKTISKKEVLNYFDLNKVDNYALLIFHPILGEERKAGIYFKDILDILNEENIHTFVSYPNVDSGYIDIINIIEEYMQNPNFTFYKNLPRDLFINLFRHTDFLIGNSSAGIYEAPLLKKPVINVGKRQQGRYAAKNVVFVEQNKKEIKSALNLIESIEFKNLLSEVTSIYGDGDSVNKAISILKSIDYKDYLYKTEDPLEEWNEQ